MDLRASRHLKADGVVLRSQPTLLAIRYKPTGMTLLGWVLLMTCFNILCHSVEPGSWKADQTESSE